MTNTVATLNGLFKERYAKKVIQLVPEGTHLLRVCPFASEDLQIGNSYHQPVALSQEQGFTYAALGSGAFALNSAVAAVHKDATITGGQIALESRIDVESLARGKGEPRSFEPVADRMVQNMKKAFDKRLELEHLYGGTQGLGRLSAISGTSTNRVLTVRLAEWAAAIWSGSEGSELDAYAGSSATGYTPGAIINSNAAIVLVSVQIAARTLTVTGNATDLTDLDTDIANAPFLFFRGQKTGGWTGLVAIARNTGSQFGVDAAAYSIWGGNTYLVGTSQVAGTQFTMAKLFAGLDPAISRGLDEDVTVYCNPRTWTNLMTDLAALRRYDASYERTKGVSGFGTIEYQGQAGKINLVSHKFMKEGEALAFVPGNVKRLGAQDVTMGQGFGMGDDMVYLLPSNMGYGTRMYTLQATFCERPASLVHFTAIANT